MIRLTDPLIPFTRIPRVICSHAPPHLSTVSRWVIDGVGSPPVRLETVKVGGRRYTTAAAIEAFVAATTAARAASAGVTAPGREAAVQAAEHDCTAQGV